MQTQTLQVVSREELVPGVVSLRLASPQGAPLPEWTAGAHIDLHLDPPENPGLVRQYSLCGDPSDSAIYRIAVLAEADGAGSRYVYETVRTGQLIQVSEPRDQFSFRHHERVTLIAGGIGITPILPMVHAAAAAGVDWRLHYAGRSRDSMPFLQELAEYGDRVQVHISAEGSRMDVHNVVNGTLSEVIYACGPARLLDELEDVTQKADGVSLRVERFVNENTVDNVGDHTFVVECELSGKTLEVPPGRSILKVAEENGIAVPSSCQGGTCGTCETFVVEGEPDHRDAILNAQEREESEVMMVCVSRCKGTRLKLEL
ncbi:PDR/VanB family oxidoreductase [Nesterenkonia haasae]|uniref:PDR/VanB family oxidoreductase n=1 Tax=Nesterenkonia haasae TaxID=2587813 RepID=UPI0013913810|nr:PDR/VanB family oxidoreductase [Nesterenkonia haasae]NDK31271.1 oxidoreductase [Nesterenkonia haasae]